MNIRFGDNIVRITDSYGQADFTDTVYEDVIRYHYLVEADFYIMFGVKDGILSSLEIIVDEDIIQDAISVRKEKRI